MVRFRQVSRLSRLPTSVLALSVLLALAAASRAQAQVQYWDDPRALATQGSRFVQSAESEGLAVVAWQEFVANAEGTGGRLYLSMVSTRDFLTYTSAPRFFGPIPYSEKEVPIYSVAVTPRGHIYCAVLTGPTSIAVLVSRDGGKSFRAAQEQTTPASTVAPYLTVTSGGALFLFVTQTVGGAAATEESGVGEESTVIQTQPITVAWSRSEDGQLWSPFTPFVTEASVGTNVKPHHVSWNGREYVVFQGLDNSFEMQYYHLFLKWSDDGGLSWREAKPLRFAEYSGGQLRQEKDFDNQRPFIAALGDKLAVAWERSYGPTSARQIYYAELDRDGEPLDPMLRPITSGGYRSSNPQILPVGGQTMLLWFDNRAEEGRIILAEPGDLRWREYDLTRATRGTNLFGRPVVLGDQLFVAWDNARGGTNTIQLLGPDRSADPPPLRAADFQPGRRDRRSTVTVRWSEPRDPSGIEAYSYSWDRSAQAGKGEAFEVAATTTSAVVTADQDGLWYFHVRARDRAGNWSEASTVAFFRDTTPPGPVAFEAPALDPRGFLTSNTFRLGWAEPPDDEIAGYTYRLEYVGPEGGAGVGAPALPARVVTTDTTVERTNADNGTWSLAVSAVDTAGNFGEVATLVFRLDKYVPVTFISNVAATVDRTGATTLTLFGRGFQQGGLVSRLYLDQDGAAPYDYEFDLESGMYTVANDRLIDRVVLRDVRPGSYLIGVRHPARGVAFAPNRITFVERGTVKLGNYTYSYQPAWELRPARRTLIDANTFLVWLVVGFLGLLLAASTRRIASLVVEARMLSGEVSAIMEGRGSTVKKTSERLTEARKRGVGLRVKFSLLMMLLVVLITLIVSIPLGYNMVQTQQRTLLDTLEKRIQVLMGSIAIGAEEPLKNPLGEGELRLSSDLPNQLDQMAEATYVLIMGAGREVEEQNEVDFLWGYKIKEEAGIDIAGFLPAGASAEDYGRNRVVTDAVQTTALELARETSGKARTELQGYREEIDELNNEAKIYAEKTDLASSQELQKISKALGERNRDLARSLIEYKKAIRSVPDFANAEDSLEPTYEFVKPIIYTLPDDRSGYVRGLVRLGVSTSTIQEEIREQLLSIIRITVLIALGAMGLGVLGAIVLASMTVAPIKKLARGVAVIRDTQDKEKLADHQIDVGTRDEIGTLAQTVNEMTRGLVAAAAASRDLMMGQEIQRRFISLDVGPDGTKGNIGGEETEKVEIFGFYEGAATVSGDYFEHVKLDDKHYAIIKGDVAGHGVSASLMMVELATLFSSFTRKWPQSQEKFRLDRFVYDVNDMLEVRGFKGRFATFTTCILNIETGVSYICNAGDKILHYYDGAERKMKALTLPNSPAAGIFPSSLVEMQSGFQQVKHTLRSGDIYVLHTDGVDEARRNFRDADGNMRTYDQPDVREEQRHGFAPKKGEGFELLETERLFGLLDACLSRSTYVMTKFYNPNPGEEFTFDFRSGSATLREVVLAVMGMEKVFRIYRDPSTDENSRIRVDRNILELLRKHYVQFDQYFGHPVDDDGKSPQVTFSHLKEDVQEDDLTMLMVRRK